MDCSSISDRRTDLSLLYNVQIGFEAHLASNPMDTEGSLTGDKAAGV
jgi:hypothetical protein